VKEVKVQSELGVRDCGLMGYQEALSLQHKLVEQRQNEKIGNTVLILEHPSVITLGVRKDLNEVLADEDVLKSEAIEVAKVRRGGGCTAHNRGQVVLYPILKLTSLGLGVNEYIRELEAVGIGLLAQLGVIAERRKRFPGLWVDERKIGSIGVRIRKWVSCHGMAINIKNDLSIFKMLVPCGLKGVQITNVLKETGKEHSMTKVKQKLAEICLEHWTSRSSKLESR
jgi:lipoate-protein ligase B